MIAQDSKNGCRSVLNVESVLGLCVRTAINLMLMRNMITGPAQLLVAAVHLEGYVEYIHHLKKLTTQQVGKYTFCE